MGVGIRYEYNVSHGHITLTWVFSAAFAHTPSSISPKTGQPGTGPFSTSSARRGLDEQIDQFRYIKFQSQTIDLSTRLWGINTEFVGFIPQNLAQRSIV